jgi:hypothetical protein
VKTIADEWADFERTLLDPIAASATQRQETRRGFYAGAQALSTLMVTGCGDSSEEEGVEVMEALSRELKAFAAEVQAGRA